jgi:hypothetical protein
MIYDLNRLWDVASSGKTTYHIIKRVERLPSQQTRSPMSAVGQELPRRCQIGVSALRPKAAATIADRRVR